MIRKLLLLTVSILATVGAKAQQDTLHISTAYTTHVIFTTDLTYADLSNSRIVVAKIIDQNKNMLALKARTEFEETTSISALESNGTMHTFIIKYDENPSNLIVDKRYQPETETAAASDEKTKKENITLNGKKDAPLLSEMIDEKQTLFHIGAKKYGITVLCESITSYSDITYIVLSLSNRSAVSYKIENATFVLESRKKGKRTVMFEKTLFPKNRFGTLSTAGNEKQKMAYSFDKMTLSNDQVLKVYFYEDGGQRNLEMTISANDINRAGKR